MLTIQTRLWFDERLISDVHRIVHYIHTQIFIFFLQGSNLRLMLTITEWDVIKIRADIEISERIGDIRRYV